MPMGYAAAYGDWTYRGTAAHEKAHIMTNEWFMAGHRDAEAGGDRQRGDHAR